MWDSLSDEVDDHLLRSRAFTFVTQVLISISAFPLEFIIISPLLYRRFFISLLKQIKLMNPRRQMRNILLSWRAGGNYFLL